MTIRKVFAIAAIAMAAATLDASADTGTAAREHVVIQVSDGDVKTWNQALNVVRNLQQAYRGNVEVEVVAFGNGIGMLKMDSEVATRVAETVSSGAKLLACENTMRGRNLTPEDMLSKIAFVPAGVVEIMQKQKAGWVVIRP